MIDQRMLGEAVRSMRKSRGMTQADLAKAIGVAVVTDAVASVSDEDMARGVEQYLLSQLQDGVRPESADLREEIEAIQRWAEAEPFAKRSEGDEKTQDRI